MVYIYTGLPGSGKTYWLTKLGLDKMTAGVHCWFNWPIDVNEQQKEFYHYWENIDETLNAQRGTIFIDEIWLYFNSREWEKFDKRWLYKILQHRKDGLDIVGAVQNIKRMDTVLREITGRYYELVKIGRLIIIYEFNVDEANKKTRKSLSTSFHWLNMGIAKRYDTFLKIPQVYSGYKGRTAERQYNKFN